MLQGYGWVRPMTVTAYLAMTYLAAMAVTYTPYCSAVLDCLPFLGSTLTTYLLST